MTAPRHLPALRALVDAMSRADRAHRRWNPREFRRPPLAVRAAEDALAAALEQAKRHMKVPVVRDLVAAESEGTIALLAPARRAAKRALRAQRRG